MTASLKEDFFSSLACLANPGTSLYPSRPELVSTQNTSHLYNIFSKHVQKSVYMKTVVFSEALATDLSLTLQVHSYCI